MGHGAADTAGVTGEPPALGAYLRARRELCAALAAYARAAATLVHASGTPPPALRFFACGHAPGAPVETDGEVILHLCPACRRGLQTPGRAFTELARLLLGPRTACR